MKQLRSLDPERQHRYEHNGRIYSIIDLTVPFIEFKDTILGDRFRESMETVYGQFKYELADVTDDDVKVIDRFSSIENAKQAILLEEKL